MLLQTTLRLRTTQKEGMSSLAMVLESTMGVEAQGPGFHEPAFPFFPDSRTTLVYGYKNTQVHEEQDGKRYGFIRIYKGREGGWGGLGLPY